MTDIVERLRKVHTEITESDGGECGLMATVREAADEIERLRAVLREIALGKGTYSMDPLTHASNTIEDMQALARAALGEGKEE